MLVGGRNHKEALAIENYYEPQGRCCDGVIRTLNPSKTGGCECTVLSIMN